MPAPDLQAWKEAHAEEIKLTMTDQPYTAAGSGLRDFRRMTDMALTTQQIAQLAAHVWTDHEHATFALLDGAGSPGLLDKLYQADGPEFECLYSGELAPDIAEVAPYIARLEPGSGFAEWVLGGWGEHRGIVVHAPDELGMAALRRHFRKLNTVYGPDGRPMLFRYYDPRVMASFLPACSDGQLKDMFGPVARYVIERGRQGEGAKFSASGGALVQELF
jgi:hypothetical protein